MSQVIEFEGQQHEFPDDFTDADIAKALGPAQPAGAPPSENYGQRLARTAYPALVEKPLADIKALPGKIAEAGQALMHPKMSTLLPLTLGPESTALTRLGTIAAGKMMDQPSSDWWENLKTATKGVGGDWQKPLTVATSPAAMEAVFPAASAAGSKLYRSTAAGRSAINATDAANFGRAAEEVAPTLNPGRTAETMQRTAEGRGLANIGAGKEVATQDVEGALTAASGMRPIPGNIYIPSMGRAMSIRDANNELSSIGDQMRGIKPLDPRFPNDVNLKQEYGRLAEEIKAGITHVAGPDAAARWAQGQSEYMAGREVGNELIGRTNLFKQGEFTMAELQRWLRNPDNRAELARKLGGDLSTGQNLGAYNRLVDAIERGAAPGMVDRLAGEAPSFFSGRGSYGTWRAPMEIFRTAFPNFASRYVGRVPYNYMRSPAEQTIADVIAAGAQR